MCALVQKRTLKELGSRVNEAAGSSVSSFARKQLEKFGWRDGQGLGKDGQGISSHVKVRRREDNVGIGADDGDKQKRREEEKSATWWHSAFEDALGGLGGSKKKKRKREREAEAGRGPDWDALFEATGGARLGMRARAKQAGKWKRTEATEAAAPTERGAEEGEGSAKRAKKEKREKKAKKERKEKKTRKEKKERKGKKAKRAREEGAGGARRRKGDKDAKA